MDFSLDAAAFALSLGFLFFVGIIIVRKAALRRRCVGDSFYEQYSSDTIDIHCSGIGKWTVGFSVSGVGEHYLVCSYGFLSAVAVERNQEKNGAFDCSHELAVH